MATRMVKLTRLQMQQFRHLREDEGPLDMTPGQTRAMRALVDFGLAYETTGGFRISEVGRDAAIVYNSQIVFNDGMPGGSYSGLIPEAAAPFQDSVFRTLDSASFWAGVAAEKAWVYEYEGDLYESAKLVELSRRLRRSVVDALLANPRLRSGLWRCERCGLEWVAKAGEDCPRCDRNVLIEKLNDTAANLDSCMSSLNKAHDELSRRCIVLSERDP